MGLNLKKLKEEQIRIGELIKKEAINNIKEDLINIVLDEDLKKTFNEDKSRKITKQSKRVISHWVKKGIVQADQTKKGGWFYFDRTESIWIDIITQLRKFGIELDKIKSIRNQLFNEEIDGFKPINFALMYSILKEPYLMLVFDDGKVSILTSSLYSKCIKDDNLPQHIVFNFFHLAKKVFPNNNFNIDNEIIKGAELSPEELKILYYIRTGDYSDISIKLLNGNIHLFEGKKRINNPNNIMEIINSKSYQNIEIKTENENAVYISSTEKIRLN